MGKMPLAVFISGSGTTLQSIIDGINEGNVMAEIRLVFSDKVDAYGLKRAQNNGIKTLVFNQLKGDTTKEKFDYLADILDKEGIKGIVLAGFMKILPENFVNRFSEKIINVHPSLIPAFCGKGMYGDKVHKAVIEYGVKVTGATVHFVDKGTDTGPIIFQEIVRVEPEDNAMSIEEKVKKIEKPLLNRAIDLFAKGKIVAQGRRVIIKS